MGQAYLTMNDWPDLYEFIGQLAKSRVSSSQTKEGTDGYRLLKNQHPVGFSSVAKSED